MSMGWIFSPHFSIVKICISLVRKGFPFILNHLSPDFKNKPTTSSKSEHNIPSTNTSELSPKAIAPFLVAYRILILHIESHPFVPFMMDGEEDASKHRLGPDFQNAQCLLFAEVAILLEFKEKERHDTELSEFLFVISLNHFHLCFFLPFDVFSLYGPSIQ